jgi:TonB family protein
MRPTKILNLLGILLSGAIAVTAALPAAAEQVAVAPQTQPQMPSKIVILAVIVETDGSISNATVDKSSGTQAADFAAIDHARHLKLAPQVVDGMPIRSQKKIAIAVKPRGAQAPQQAQQPGQPSQPVAQPTIKAVPVLNV